MATSSLHASSEEGLSTGALIRRLLGLSWAYRIGCIKTLLLQLSLVALGLSGLGFTGLGIDYIRSQVQPDVPPVRWPWGLSPPADWPALGVVLLIAGLVFGFAALRATLNYFYTVQAAGLVQGKIVVNLRDQVYNKLQRLSFRFFD
jgi:ATP-binding cassette subfamily B protein